MYELKKNNDKVNQNVIHICKHNNNSNEHISNVNMSNRFDNKEKENNSFKEFVKIPKYLKENCC